MNELLTTLGFVFRTWDGRGDDNANPAPPYWNVYLYLGLALIMYGYTYFEHLTALQAFGIYAVVLTYLLTGYKSLTLPWVFYLSKRFYLFIYKQRMYFRYKSNTKSKEEFKNAWDWLCFSYKNNNNRIHAIYEQTNGFHTWHMAYRYVIAGAIICAILDNWNAYYLLACSLAGASFPMRVRWWNTEASARLTEGLLGAVKMGWVWLI